MNDLTPSFTEFRRLAKQGNLVPVFKSVVADELTPVSAFRRLAQGRAYSCLLESVEGGEKLGRYTYLGIDPFMLMRCRGERIRVQRGRQTEDIKGNIFDVLRELSQHRPPRSSRSRRSSEERPSGVRPRSCCAEWAPRCQRSVSRASTASGSTAS